MLQKQPKKHPKKAQKVNKLNKRHFHKTTAQHSKLSEATKQGESVSAPNTPEALKKPELGGVAGEFVKFQKTHGKIYYPVLTGLSMATLASIYGLIQVTGYDSVGFFTKLSDHRILGDTIDGIWNGLKGNKGMYELITAEPKAFADVTLASVFNFMLKPIRLPLAFKIAKNKVAEQQLTQSQVIDAENSGVKTAPTDEEKLTQNKSSI